MSTTTRPVSPAAKPEASSKRGARCQAGLRRLLRRAGSIFAPCGWEKGAKRDGPTAGTKCQMGTWCHSRGVVPSHCRGSCYGTCRERFRGFCRGTYRGCCLVSPWYLPWVLSRDLSFLSVFATCRGMPSHHLLQTIPRHLPRHTTEPSTGLHGIQSNLNSNPNPNLGAVDIGVPCVVVAAGVVMVPPMACHGTPHGTMESYATISDAMGMPWFAMGGTMAIPQRSQIE